MYYIIDFSHRADKKPLQVPLDTWEMGIATGDTGLLDNSIRKDFCKFYGALRNYNQLSFFYLMVASTDSSDVKRKAILDYIDKSKNSWVAAGKEILQKYKA